jgi:hypothetical protein
MKMATTTRINSIVPELEKLEESFKNADDTSRETLYANLEKAMGVVRQIDANPEFAKEVLGVLKKKKIRVRSDTDNALMVLKATITGERKKADEYAIVIRKAESKGITKNLGKWITENNGINAIRRKEDPNKPKTGSRKDVIEAALLTLDGISTPLVSVKIPNAKIDEIKEKFAVAIARVGKGETVDVLSVIDKKTVVSAAVYEYGKEFNVKPRKTATEKASGMNDAVVAAIKEAATP